MVFKIDKKKFKDMLYENLVNLKEISDIIELPSSWICHLYGDNPKHRCGIRTVRKVLNKINKKFKRSYKRDDFFYQTGDV